MTKVINQYKTYKDDNWYKPIIYGTCSNCGETVRYDQYSYDEKCPKCKENLDWGEIEC